MNSGHSLVGPSSLAALIACPGKTRMERTMPDETSWVAYEGSVAHEIAEKKLLGKPHLNVGAAVVGPTGNKVVVDQSMIDATDIYVSEIQKIRNTGFGIERVEQKITLEHFTLPEVWGTVDYSYAIPFGCLYIRDYKHGQGVVVSPENNPQMMAYALGVACTPDVLDSYDEINLGIIQPRGKSGNAASEWRTTPKELSEWCADILIPAVVESLRDNAPLNPGEKQCMFCRAKAHCPALAQLTMISAQKEFREFTLLHPDAPDNLSMADVAAIYSKIKLINGFLKSIEARMFNTLATGGTVAGYKLIKGRRSRSWNNESKALEILEKVLGDKAYEKKLLTPAKAEKALGKEDRKLLEEYISTEEGKPSIAEESNEKPAIAMIEDDFKQYINTDNTEKTENN